MTVKARMVHQLSAPLITMSPSANRQRASTLLLALSCIAALAIAAALTLQRISPGIDVALQKFEQNGNYDEALRLVGAPSASASPAMWRMYDSKIPAFHPTLK